MNVAIKYRGCLDDLNRMDEFINEVAAIADELGCASTLIQPNLDKTRSPFPRGIKIYLGSSCSPLLFLFNKTGVLIPEVEDTEHFVTVRIYDQIYSMHTLVVRLLRYLQKTYMSNLTVKDPTGYWRHEDFEKLKRNYLKRARTLSAVHRVLANRANTELLTASEGLALEHAAAQLTRRLQQVLQRRIEQSKL